MPQFILVELPSFRLKTLAGQPVSLAPKYVALFSSLYQYVRAGLAISAATTTNTTSSYSSSAYSYSPDLSTSTSSSSSASYAMPPATTTAPASLPEVAASLLFAGGEPDLWTPSSSTSNDLHTLTSSSLHPEEALLLSYFQSFNLPGAYPIVDALLFGSKPCSSCMGYFTSPQGKTLRVPSTTTGGGSSGSRRSGDASSSSSSNRRSAGGGSSGGGGGNGTSFRARFTPRSDRSYTPIFYLARSLDAAGRAGLWFEMASMWGSAFLPDPAAAALDLGGDFGAGAAGAGGGGMLARGQMYWLVPGSAWFAVHEQETMTDAEVAEAVMQQGGMLGYWVGR